MIVVNYSSEAYRKPERRLADSLRQAGVRYLAFAALPDGSPTHQQSPYEFKIHAIRKAMEIDPIVLWADASMYLVGDIKIIENIIVNDGFFGQEAGHYVGDWCNRHTRDYFNLKDSEYHIPMFSAGLLGLNADSEKAMDFLNQWELSAKAGCFRGEWTDHRHDMSCASIIYHRLGFKLQRGGSTMAYIGPGYSTPEPQVSFYCQGIL